MSYATPANNCTFMGRVSKAPTVTQIQMGVDQNGQPNMVDKAMFSVAVDRQLTPQQRQKIQAGDTSIKNCDFVPLSATGAVVKFIQSYCPQGKAIIVKCHYSEYTTKDQQTGQTKYGHTFEVDDITFATQDSKNLQGNNGGQQASTPSPAAPANTGYPQNYGQPAAPTPAQSPNANFSMFDANDQPF